MAISTVVVAQPRDLGTFCGNDNVDTEEWLAIYERSNQNNQWDDTVMLANIPFYLQGKTRVLFQNHEEEIGSWHTYKERCVLFSARLSAEKSRRS